MEITEQLLGERYRFETNYIPYPLTQSQGDARKLFLEEIHKKRKYVSITECPYCGYDRFIKISEVDRRGLPAETVLCGFCSGCFKSSILNPEANRYHYENISYILRGKETSDDAIERCFWERVSLFAYPRYHFIRHFIKLNPNEGCIAEFGCNDGANLYPWLKDGFTVLGIELDRRMIEFGRKKGLNLIWGDLLEYNGFDKKPKLIILSHVLEHICDINIVVNRLREILEPDGYLFIESPGIRVQGLGEVLSYFDIEHNYNFDFNSLSRVIKRHSFKIMYADEYIRLLCTPSQNHSIPAPPPVSLSRDRVMAGLIKVFIDLANLGDRDLYGLIGRCRDNALMVKIIKRLQMLYFKFHYSSIAKNQAG